MRFGENEKVEIIILMTLGDKRMEKDRFFSSVPKVNLVIDGV